MSQENRVAAFHHLCASLRGEAPDAPSVRAGGPISWAGTIAMAQEFRVAPALASAIERSGGSARLPGDAAALLTGLAAHARARNERIRAQARNLARLLNGIDVTPVFLKGGAHLLSGLYPDTAMRQMSDLDILVPAGRIPDCARVLDEEGIRPTTDYEYPRAHHLPPRWRADLPVPVEVHHGVLAHPWGGFLTAQEVFASARVMRENGATFAVPSPATAILHNIAHAQLNDYSYLYGRLDLRGLGDLALLSQAHASAIDWQAIFRRFARRRTGLAYHVLGARELLGASVPLAVWQRGAAAFLYRRAIGHIADPAALGRSVRMLEPAMLLRRELSESALRRRLIRNLGDGAWWRRHLAMLRGR